MWVQSQKTQKRAGYNLPLVMGKRVRRVFVKTVHNTVAESSEIGKTISQFKDLFNERITTFNMAVGNSKTVK